MCVSMRVRLFVCVFVRSATVCCYNKVCACLSVCLSVCPFLCVCFCVSVSVCLFLCVLTCLNEPNCVSEYGGSGGSLAFLSQKSHLTLLKRRWIILRVCNFGAGSAHLKRSECAFVSVSVRTANVCFYACASVCLCVCT